MNTPASAEQIALRRQAAEGCNDLANQLQAAGLAAAARVGFRAAAELDLMDAALQASWGGPLNGQASRRLLVLDLLARIGAGGIIETGTYRATTTCFLAENFAGPIDTCEVNPRFFLQSQQKLAGFPQVRVVESDSRSFLRQVLAARAGNAPLFIYLDAHWHDDLPLREELAIILAAGVPAVVMVDDFAVPFDPGYAFDDYGPGKALNTGLLLSLLNPPVRLFFPATPAEAETGARRGCCVLSTTAELGEALAACPMLRTGDWRDWELSSLQAQVREMDALRQQAAGQQADIASLQAALAVAQAPPEAQALALVAPLPGLARRLLRLPLRAARAVLRRLAAAAGA